MSEILPPTFPARPVNGGPLPKARAKLGRWCYEPKVNGWRTLVHTPTGTMFNRKGERLSIEREFAPVLETLRTIAHPHFEWLDCEGFERRHPLGRGSLVLLDVPLAPGTYEQRQQDIWLLVHDGYAQSWAHEQFTPPENQLLSFADLDDDPLAAWVRLQNLNVVLGCDLFEGLVAKRADSPYPLQRRSPDEEFTGWMKHRWSF